MKNTLILLTILSLLTSCSPNYFEKAFVKDQALKAYNNDLIKKENNPKVFYLKNPELETIGIIENGFINLGYAFFEEQEFDDKKQAVNFAKKIDASLILIHSKHIRTQKLYDDINTTYPVSATPITNNIDPLNSPETTVSYDFSSKKLTKNIPINTATQAWNIPIEKRNYYAIPNGNSAIIVPNDDGNTVKINTYYASFWAKTNYPPALGVKVNDISSEIKKEFHLKNGVSVWAVDKNSPASKAKVYRGDLLLSINNTPIKDALSMGGLIRENIGKTIQLVLFRNGENVTKKIKLNTTSY